MKALRTQICTYAIALLVSLGFSTSAMAGSGDFSGIFGALKASAAGVELNGTHTTGTGDAQGGGTLDEVAKGRIGAVVPLGGYEIGFNLPLGDVFFIGVAHSWIKGGAAMIAEGDDFQDTSDFQLKASDHKSYYIMPSISVFDNSAVYVKYGKSYADLTLTGGVAGAPNNMNGTIWGIGTVSQAPNGIFVRTEASVASYDQILVTGIGGDASAIVEGNPTVAAGSVSIGYKF